ncbi:MAG: thiol:disulfide interchange protein DsbA/DsbL [Cardiobacteriaceae bacterium]|nr:thiol:disulfide interchange protein DsbA/DsbL [Cardiobacteriaceae bacterium]
MKKLLMTAALAALLPLSAQAQMKYLEGQDYNTLPKAVVAVEKPTVIEFFWFGCPHCYTLHPEFEQWINEKKPEGVTIEKMPAIPSDNWATGAQLFYAAEQLGLDMAAFEKAAFDAFHKDRDRGVIIDPKKAQGFLVKHGADAAAVEKAWNSFAVKQKMERARQIFDDSGVDGVPAFLVNGRYVAGVGKSYERTFDLLQTLALNKPHQENGEKPAEGKAEEAPAKAEEAGKSS